MRRALLLGMTGGLAAALLAGCGTAARSPTIKVAIEIKVAGPPPRSARFSLTCNPTSGTLPRAGRVCALIAARPETMLRHQPALVLCYSPERSPMVTVHATWRGKTSTFSGEPGCGWPISTPLSVYYNASQRR